MRIATTGALLWRGLRRGAALTLLFPALVSSISRLPAAEVRSGQAHAAAPASLIKFENVIHASKIQFALKNGVSPQRYTFETMVGGVALFDYNNDGLLDVFFTNGAAIPSLEKSGPQYCNRLFRNNGDGTFTDVTEKAGLEGIGARWMAPVVKLDSSLAR